MQRMRRSLWPAIGLLVACAPGAPTQSLAPGPVTYPPPIDAGAGPAVDAATEVVLAPAIDAGAPPPTDAGAACAPVFDLSVAFVIEHKGGSAPSTLDRIHGHLNGFHLTLPAWRVRQKPSSRPWAPPDTLVEATAPFTLEFAGDDAAFLSQELGAHLDRGVPYGDAPNAVALILDGVPVIGLRPADTMAHPYLDVSCREALFASDPATGVAVLGDVQSSSCGVTLFDLRGGTQTNHSSTRTKLTLRYQACP